jgi:polynucleotide kinase-phosphatase
MRIEIPELSLVVLVGASGSGKSSFARKHFLPTEVVSSDGCRALVSDDENDQSATKEAFTIVHLVSRLRLKRGKLTVVDATNVQKESRRPLVELAKETYVVPVALVIDTPENVCRERNVIRPDRQFGGHVIRNQVRDLRRSVGMLRKEGFRHIHVIRPEDMENLEIVRSKMWTDLREEAGPFDIIGDVHGCYDELIDLMATLGYSEDGEHPDGRRVIFLGDLVDRGPKPVEVLRLVMAMVGSGRALCVPGNHDDRLARALKGNNVTLSHGLAETLVALEAESEEFRKAVRQFIEGLVSHAVLDNGKLVVAHAGMREDMQGRASSRVRDFALYGETTGESDEFGLPIRYNWAMDYRGQASVVYGHTPVHSAEWLNRTICLDTGCAFGGQLTALRWPEKVLMSVDARYTYAEPIRPIGHITAAMQHESDELLDIDDVRGRRHISTRFGGMVIVAEEYATAALEVMSRFAMNPKWLVHLPPTMSPCATSRKDGYLEYPTEAFDFYRENDVTRVVCETKHMGSRALAMLCRNEDVAASRFGVSGEGIGAIATRTGRHFFEGSFVEQSLLARMNAAFEKAGLWDELDSDWAVIDLELMPWSAKALELLQRQYGAVGAAARRQAESVSWVLDRLEEKPEGFEQQMDEAARFVAAYQKYCWKVESLDDYKLAPFHLLASEGAVHHDKDHLWHMETLGRACDADPAILMRTPYRVVDLEDEAEVADACKWWEAYVGGGGEGMVVKPLDFFIQRKGRPLQPAVKVRGPEYLRIIYGPSYLRPENLSQLRKRGLGAKRALAAKEFALGMESLTRFVEREPLRRVHECVFGVLALESEPVDPRL